MGSAGADREGDPFWTNTPTAKRDARTRELVAEERAVAETHRSGVRAKTSGVDAAPSFDLSNAVTKVQRAVELDHFLPPSVEVTVVVSKTISVAPAERPVSRAAPAAPELARGVNSHRAPSAHAPVISAPALAPKAPVRVAPRPHPRGIGRRALALLIVLAVMGGACTVLVAAARRGRIPLPPAAARVLDSAVRLLR